MQYVLPDTNILINDPGAVKKLVTRDIYVVIPVTVLNELDSFKLRKDLGFKVRETGRVIEEILNQKNKHLILTNDFKVVHGLVMKKADDRILATALRYNEDGKNVLLLTNDRFLRLKAEGLGVQVSTLEKQLITPGNPPWPVPLTPLSSKPAEMVYKIEESDMLPAGNDAYIIITSPTHLYQNRQLGFKVEGFNEKYLSRVKQIKPGDRFIYYVAGDKLFAAITEITSKVYFDKTELWSDEAGIKMYHHLKMEPRIVLKPAQVLSAHGLVSRLSFIHNKAKWVAYFQGSIKRIPAQDYALIEWEMKNLVSKWSK